MPKRLYAPRFLRFVQANAGVIPIEEILRVAEGLYATRLTKRQLYGLCAARGWSLIPQTLSGDEVAKLMGVTYPSARAFWLTGEPPLLASRGRYGSFGPHHDAGRWYIASGDLYQFIYHHPEAYDWRTIKREPYRGWGKRATERLGLLFLEEVVARIGVPYATLLGWIKRYDIPGVVPQPIGRVRWRVFPEALPYLRDLKRDSYRKIARGVPLRIPLPPPPVEPPRLLALLAVEIVGGKIQVRHLEPLTAVQAIG